MMRLKRLDTYALRFMILCYQPTMMRLKQKNAAFVVLLCVSYQPTMMRLKRLKRLGVYIFFLWLPTHYDAIET